MKQLIAAIAEQKQVPNTRKQFVIDSNCVFEALLAAMSAEEILEAIKRHGLKGPGYTNAARVLRIEAMKRKGMPRTNKRVVKPSATQR
jgi:hypothetical protein